MISANDPRTDYIDFVCKGYDKCAKEYSDARSNVPPKELTLITNALKPKSKVLDIGCGSGIPITQELSKMLEVIGIDISEAMIKLAKHNVPSAEFLCQNVMSASLADNEFDGIVSFYALFHIPRDQHKALLTKIYRWLKPKGLLLFTIAHTDDGDGYIENNFFETEMYWSNFGPEYYRKTIESIGFEIRAEGILGHGYDDNKAVVEKHPYLFAIKK
jgi:ubiquinone/menaquinone biosynthesis C-methylase UbiE